MVRSILALVGAAIVTTAPGSLAAQPVPLEINAILPLTGGAAFLGAKEAETLGVVERLVNGTGGIGGRPIKFVIQDDGGVPQNTVVLTNGLIAKNVDVIVGSAIAALCGAQEPLTSHGPVVYCLSPAVAPAPGSYMFSANVGSRDFVATSIRYFKAHGWTRIALLTSTDATGRDQEQAFDAEVATPDGAGMQIVTHEHFATGDLSVAAQLARIKAANPQVLVAWSSGTSFGTVLRNITDAGITMPIFTSSANLSHAQLAQYRSFAPKLYFVAGGGAAVQGARGKQRDAQLAFVNAFRAAGLRAEYLDTLAWDPAMIVVDALRKLGASASSADLRAYIGDLHDWTGIVGTYDFRRYPQRGVGRAAATVYEWNPQTDEIAVVPFTP